MRHKSELAAVQQAAAEESRRQLEVQAVHHEMALKQLKERMIKVLS